ncbi:hypothetical protein KXD40_005715 [Peronospora effusa]|nr:hypothetical protein KXD40_005715 [Peronospora effusa]
MHISLGDFNMKWTYTLTKPPLPSPTTTLMRNPRTVLIYVSRPWTSKINLFAYIPTFWTTSSGIAPTS